MDFRVISDTSAGLVGRLDYLQGRHNLLTQNIAHLETPDYHRKDIEFEGFLGRGDDPYAVNMNAALHVREDKEGVKSNGNNVVMEEEMARLASNSVEYMAAIESLKKNLALMKIAVADR